MSSKKYLPSSSPDQSFLLPPSPHDWLPENHLAFFVLSVAEMLDLGAIEGVIHSKDPRGQRPYSPRTMVGLLLYAYSSGTFSSRRIERATYEDVGTRVVAGESHPDHATIARFRKDHADALSDLFVQVLELCQKAGMVRLGRVALDGTRLKANASKHKAMSYEHMAKKKARLKQEVVDLLARAEAADAEEDAAQGDENLLLNVLPEVKRREDYIRKLDAAMAELQAEAKAARAAELEAQAQQHAANAEDSARTASERKLASTLVKKREEAAAALRDDDDLDPPEPPAQDASGQGNLFRRPGSSNDGINERVGTDLPEHIIRHYANGTVHPKAQHNFTDPESRIMEHQGGFIQGFNGQVVATEDQIILAHGLSNAAPDTYYLQPLLDRVEANVGERPEVFLADTGYWSEPNAEYLERNRIDGYIATGRESYIVDESSGSDPPETARDGMRAKLKRPEGREQYRARKWMVEPVFGQIKEAMGFRQMTRRGLQAARAEWGFVCTVHNLLKLWRAGAPLPA
ncbi:MAG: IS1182 family transposase [Polyangiaceae bacterium]|nr:IS1182 family transposase [Polyangiaceae bacterium]